MIRFIHTADIHFGVENYGRIESTSGIHSRLLDFDRAYQACIDTAINEQVDFFLFAGDAYKTAHPTPTQQRLFIKGMLRLYAAGIPVVIVVGNHDNPLSYGKAHALDLFSDLPLDGFHVVAKPTTITLSTKNGPVQIVGIPWPSRTTIALSDEHLETSSAKLTEYITRAVSHIIQDKAAKLDPKIPAILAGHLTVSSGIFSGSEKRAIYGNDPLFMPSQLAIQPFDYVGLGHLHRFQNLNAKDATPIIYSGSLERIDFGERKEEKGFCLVVIKEKGSTEYTFIPTPTRPFIQLEVELKAGISQTEQLLAELRKLHLKDAIVKILFHIPAEEKNRVDLPTIQRACADAHYLVDIIPIRHQAARERRTTLKVDMNLKESLSAYFDTKPELKKKKERLINKALELYAEDEEAASE